MSTEPNVLLVDDDEDALLSLVRALKSSLPGIPLHAASSAEKTLKLITETAPSVLVMDLCIDERRGPESGFELLKAVTKQDPTIRIIVLTGYGSVEAGVKCLEFGASSFLEKPPDTSHLAALIKDGINQSSLRRSFNEFRTKNKDILSSMIIGSSTVAQKIRDEIRYAAQTNQPILVTGETGTGKGLCALAIHKLSKRANNKFIRYQPTFGAGDLIGSELFGHVKGAFTGADSARTGLIEEANNGTLFLDEVDELPIETQVTLLGVLQDKKVRKLGSNSETEANFRLITATNQSIEESVKSKKVREDFYHRIAHLRIQLPPLKDRLSDIKEIAENKLSLLRDSEDISILDVSEDAIQKLKSYSWPGNIRELEAVIEGAAYRAQFQGHRSIEPDDLAMPGSKPLSSTPLSFQEQVESYKLKLIDEALSRNSGNQVKAARDLGLDRSSMRRILKRGQTPF